MRHNVIILLLSLLLLAACNPLRNVQRNQKVDSAVIDRSEIHYAVTDILRESGTFTQTIVEFYPPSVPPPKYKPEPEPPIIPPPAIKRIIRTEITAERERTTATDSIARNDIHTEAHSELSEKVVEKPPATTMGIKWIAIGLAAIAAIILILKFPKIRFPRIKL